METMIPPYRKEYIRHVINEQLIYESFLSSIKDFAKDKLGKAVDTITDWKDAAVVFSRILKSKELLIDFLSPLQRLVHTQIKKLYGILKKVKLDGIIKKIKKFFEKISSLDGWKKLFALIAIGGVALYASTKLPTGKLKNWITTTLVDNFVDLVTSKLTDWKSYIGYLGPIVGGGAIIFKLLQPLLKKFEEALKSGNKLATKLIKENKRIMKKTQLITVIKNRVNEILEQEDKEKTSITIPSTLKTLIGKLDPNIDLPILSMALGKIAQGKENSLSLKESKLLSEVFIALMKNKDVALSQKFIAVFKQIK